MKKSIKHLCSLVIITLAFGNAFSQDVITFTDGRELKAKVVEVSDKSIKYKKHDNPDGPAYSAAVLEVKKIKYANGSEDTFGGGGSASASGSAEPAPASGTGGGGPMFNGKFNIEDEATHDYLEITAKEAGEKLLEACTGNVDNSSVEIYWDQVYRDDVKREIILAIIVKWDRGLTNKQRWIRGRVLISSDGKKTWDYQNDSGLTFSACAKRSFEF